MWTYTIQICHINYTNNNNIQNKKSVKKSLVELKFMHKIIIDQGKKPKSKKNTDALIQ